MRTIAKLFGRSPFVPIQHHMEHVAQCVTATRQTLEAYMACQDERVEMLAHNTRQHEQAADEMKLDIERLLKGGMFLSVDRNRMRQVIIVQDALAGKASRLAMLLTLKPLKQAPPFADALTAFATLSFESFEAVQNVVADLDELQEATFTGVEAQQIREKIQRVGDLKDQAESMRYEVTKAVFAEDENLSQARFYIWVNAVKQLSDLSVRSHRLAKRIADAVNVK